jgi:hypothetical protein
MPLGVPIVRRERRATTRWADYYLPLNAHYKPHDDLHRLLLEVLVSKALPEMVNTVT